ncbi:hypothetical protein B0T25DRAFT_336321 [Lasiosphaeria hispida]|uniref:PCI domain-containing protein n=1 Tax=Lasiosphaeria hispida TaxID=260671 RepID=A0AAJ0H618_9PEZI|nr:hypothetical protein B0T25DRAFT_336321 [Lasiosphaeria hispida]
MEQTKALNALEPFLALSKSATSPRAAADLIVRATSTPNAFIFTELLQTPQVQALTSSSDEYAPYLTLLQIFSYGTYTSLTDGTAAHALPTLNDAQKLKLRQLSLLTLARGSNQTSSDDTAASTSGPALSYPSLLSLLDLPSPRELEELVVSTIYAGLIHAQLDPKNELVRVNSVAALRDVAPGSDNSKNAIGGLLSSLQAWAGRCEATLQSLEAQMSGLRADVDRRAAHAAAWSDKMDRLVEDEQRGGASSGLPSVGSGNVAITRAQAAGSAAALGDLVTAADPHQHQQRRQLPGLRPPPGRV